MKNDNVDFFKKNGYCVVKSVVDKELRDFVTQYALFDEMQNFTPDTSQVVGAHAKYGDPAMETMLLHLHSTMEENTGLLLHPTYSFYRVYRNGDELVKHSDRESCEISCTLCFNYEFAQEDFNWPIFINDNAVNLEPGDMVIYRGCDLIHWREKLTCLDVDWHLQGFFHYVDQNGPYSHFKYDGRKSVGELKKPLANLQTKNYIISTENQ